MNFVAVFMVIFSMIAAADRIFGNRLGLGKEFEKGFMLLGSMALSMIGMIVISPFLADLLSPLFDVVWNVLHIDPSIIPASLFANDMGGAPLSVEAAKNEAVGRFNALVVSAMMGCTISFTIPTALGLVPPERHKPVLLGFLCGIVTIPVGCFAGGLAARIPIGALLIDLLPLVLFSGIIAAGLLLCPMVCVRVFDIFGRAIKIVITIGLALGVLRYLTGVEVLPGLATLEEGAAICLNASAVMSGAFPFIFLISKALTKPLRKLGTRLGINETSALGIVSSLATSLTTYEMVKDMDEKGIVLNSAFAISGAFTFAGHLAFTLAFDAAYIVPVILGKLLAGITALLLAVLIHRRIAGRGSKLL